MKKHDTMPAPQPLAAPPPAIPGGPRAGLIVTCERGLTHNGKHYKQGTSLEKIPCDRTAIQTWQHFGQIGFATS